jgi:hypothetical protein
MRKRRVFLFIVAVTLTAGVVGTALPNGSIAPCETYRFDRAAWQDSVGAPGEAATGRQQVADELLECEYLEGRTRNSIVSELGPPDETDGAEVHYALGPERGILRFDTEYLVLRFAGHRLVHASIEGF